MSDIVYTATETASDFHTDTSFVRILLGPVGPGKSVACCLEILKLAMTQQPGADGIRRTRFAIIRNTYPDLESTTLATWKTWYPEDKWGRIKMSSPISHHLKRADIDCEVLFLALDKPDDIRKLRSLELTAIYLNEVQYIPYSVFQVCRERVNRFPPKILGAPITWAGVIADSNLPDTDHWLYKKIDAMRPEGYSIHRYKPAVIKIDGPIPTLVCKQSLQGTWYTTNPSCDYLWVQNDPEYWIKLVPGSTDEEIKVILQGEYGMVMDGKPVHPAYNDMIHCANKEIAYEPALTLGMGWDFGLTPAVVFKQMTARGQLLSIGELYSEDMGLRDFASNIVLPHLDQNYPEWRRKYVSRHDPAGEAGSQTDGRNCREILGELGIESAAAARNNNPIGRRDSTDYFLGRLVDGMPAYLLSTKTPMLRKGMMGAYKYARVKVGGDERYHDKPLKNLYSHTCEAAEYIDMFYASENKRPPPSDKKPFRIYTGDFMGM
jgi:hypothetical protein